MESKNACIVVKQGNTGTNVTHSATLRYSDASMIVISSIEPNSTFVAGKVLSVMIIGFIFILSNEKIFNLSSRM